MGKKKDREESQEIPQAESNGHSASAGIFNTLFGSAPEQTTASSIFSDNNPFRRKPQESASGLDTINDTANPSNGGSENHASGELKKRKRNIEKNSNSDSDSASEAFEKKLKLVSESNSAIALAKEEKNKASEIATESNDISNEAEKKRKRKRDELEKEWESKMYGTAAEEEDEREGLGNKTVGSKRKALYNPADMLVSKEGFDDEDKLLRTIFVGNLPTKVKKKTLLKEFKKFGEVESVRIRSVPLLDTKKPRKGAILSKKINDTADSVHAYIVFKTEQAAQASLSHNMAVVGGNHIRVDRACPPRKKHKGENAPLYDNRRTVFVGNLPFDVKDEELYQLFSGLAKLESSIEAVRVIRDPHINVGKGIAYVLFKTREAANLVVKKRNLKLRDRELRISHARADATPSKRPSSSASHAFSTPAKKLAGAPSSRSPASTNNRSNRNINMSYQGLRATKTSSQNQKKFKSQNQKGEKSTERKNKRPAVAARKAKAQLLKNGGSSSKQAGTKRKQLDTWSPDNSHRNKKSKNN